MDLSSALDALTSQHLDDILANANEDSPRLKAQRVARVAELLASGALDFEDDVLSLATKPYLQGMCDALALDRGGTVEALVRRLVSWFVNHGRPAAKPATSASPVKAPAAWLSLAPAPATPPPSLDTLSSSELEFIEVTKPGLLSDMVRGVGQVLGSRNVIRIPPAEAERRFRFDDGYPREGVVYVRHPFEPNRYLPADVAAAKIAQEKRAAIITVAGLLGAIRVDIVDVKAETTTGDTSAAIAIAAKQIGFDGALEQHRLTGNSICMQWPESRTSPIPAHYRRYLDTVPELTALEALVAAGRPPSLMHQDVHIDFRESVDVAARVAGIQALGKLGGRASSQSFVKSYWTLRIWFAIPRPSATPPPLPPPRVALPPSPPVPAPAPSATNAARFCGRCGAARPRSEDAFCPACGTRF